MRDAVVDYRADSRADAQRGLDAIHRVASIVRATYAEETASLNARIAKCLLPVEPFRQAWNVFRLLDVEYDETRWTQWLAAVFRRENGELCARVAWSAFCDAVARTMSIAPPTGGANLATAADWIGAAAEVPDVQDEVAAGALGRLDLLFTAPSLVAAVENKLWADCMTARRRPRQIATCRSPSTAWRATRFAASGSFSCRNATGSRPVVLSRGLHPPLVARFRAGVSSRAPGRVDERPADRDRAAADC